MTSGSVDQLAGQLGNLGDLARTVGETVDLHNDMDGGGRHLVDSTQGQFDARKQNHRGHTRKRVTGGVRVKGRQRPVMAGVHRLEHVKHLRPAALADDDPVGTHTQGVDKKVSDGHLASPFNVGRPAFQTGPVGLDQTQLRGVFNGDDAFIVRDKLRNDVKKRCFTRTRTAGNNHVLAPDDAGVQEIRHGRGEAVEMVKQILYRVPFLRKFTDRDHGPLKGQRGDDRVDSRAVRKPRVNHRC